MTDEQRKKLFLHYWICHTCATERGGVWPKDRVATCVLMTCKYCGGENQKTEWPTAAPYIDYDWPKQCASIRAGEIEDD